MSFDVWFEEEYGNYSGQSDKSKAKMYIAYEAGAASRQGEVDELQKRIDKALYKLPWLNWKNIDGKMKGEIMDILKGKKDE